MLLLGDDDGMVFNFVLFVCFFVRKKYVKV